MKKKIYEQPVVKVTRVGMEESVAQMVRVSCAVYLEQDWQEWGELGADSSTEGGDIYLY